MSNGARDLPDDTIVDAPSGAAADAPAVLDASEQAFRSDRYETRRLLGRGGMGDIQLVHDSVVGRDVALKQLRAVSMRLNPRARERFDHEARLQGQLEHPSIVPVYDMGVGADGIPFFTMKRVRGHSLQDVLEKLAVRDADTCARYTRRRLLAALSQVCLAAHFAHERGVVHRDIKPANIMLGNYGEVYLLDWGIAKAGDTSRDDAPPSSHDLPETKTSQHTMTGTILGTLRTMSPEQATGLDVDARADVYALGAVLFETLTLRALHGRGNDHEILFRIVEGVDARPSVRAPDMDVPPELEDICVAATKRNPVDRIQTARELHERIEAYLDGDRDVLARKKSSQQHAAHARGELDKILRDADPEATDKMRAVETERDTTVMDPNALERVRRKRALREVGRALALDPDNQEALLTLVRLLTNPPRHVPPEVIAEQQTMWRKHLRRGGIAGAVVYGYISINALSTMALGVHDWTTFFAAHALWFAAFVASAVSVFAPSYVALFCAFLFGTGASLWVTSIYSPHLMIPSLLAVHAALYSLVRLRWLRRAVLAIAALAWTMSVFGESTGLFPDVVRFVDGGMVIRSQVVDFPETTTTVYLYAAVLAMILFPAIVIGFLRDSYHATDEQLRLQAWQFRQLVPSATESEETTTGR